MDAIWDYTLDGDTGKLTQRPGAGCPDRLVSGHLSGRCEIATTTEITTKQLFEIYYGVPPAERQFAYWLMSQETLDRIKELPEVEAAGPVEATPGVLIGKPIRIEPDAEGVQLVVPTPSRPRNRTADLNITSKVELETLAIVRPGDTLIVAYPRQLTGEQAEVFMARAKERLPGVEVVIIHANQLAVYRPDGA